MEIKFNFPSSRLPDVPRQAFRFTVIGFIGTFVQTAFFLVAMQIFGRPEKETALYYVAFAIGFILEMIPNYIFTNLYTFGTRPSIKNAGAFLGARGVNFVIQFLLLPALVHLLPGVNNGFLSLLVIFVAGIINFLILRVFFKKKQ